MSVLADGVRRGKPIALLVLLLVLGCAAPPPAEEDLLLETALGNIVIEVDVAGAPKTALSQGSQASASILAVSVSNAAPRSAPCTTATFFARRRWW